MKIGIERLISDLIDIGSLDVTTTTDSANIQYAVLSEYVVPAGTHMGKKIVLAIPAPDDYPRSVGASIHVKASPQLYEEQNVANVRNITKSNLGTEWKYWSCRFSVQPTDTTSQLLSQINNVFKQN